jgi:phosphoribosylanthranilate isomerase
MIKVKICGITNSEDALMASSCGADALGFIFAKKSPRCLGEGAARKIIQQLDPLVVKVGVFLDEDRQKAFDTAERLNLDVLQFHGSEAPSYCHSFKPRFKVIKVFFPDDSPLPARVSRYNVDAFMFDVRYQDKVERPQTLPAGLLRQIRTLIKEGKNIIISGGLNPANVERFKKLRPYALDVASGVEKLVGKKDEQLVKLFIKRVQK